MRVAVRTSIPLLGALFWKKISGHPMRSWSPSDETPEESIGTRGGAEGAQIGKKFDLRKI
jgi:hypothetical protein